MVCALACGTAAAVLPAGRVRADSAQAPALRPIPSEFTQRFQSLYLALQPSARTWVHEQGLRVTRAKTLDPHALRALVLNRFAALRSPGPNSQLAIQALVFLVMMQAVQNTDQDLRTAMAQAQAIAAAKQRLRGLLEDTTRELADAPAAGSPSMPCRSAFCQSLPAKLADLSSATAGLRRPVPVAAPAQASYADLALLQGHLRKADDTLNDLNNEQQLEIQEQQDRVGQLEQTLSNILKTIQDVDRGILSNLR